MKTKFTLLQKYTTNKKMEKNLKITEELPPYF